MARDESEIPAPDVWVWMFSRNLLYMLFLMRKGGEKCSGVLDSICTN